MVFKRAKHHYPSYDPDWLSGSIYVTLPIAGTVTMIFQFLVYGDVAPEFDGIVFAVGISPVLAAVALALVHTLRKWRDEREVTHGREWDECIEFKAEDVGNERLLVAGEVAELATVQRELNATSPRYSVIPYTRATFLHGLFAMCLLAWPLHKYADIERSTIGWIIAALIGASICWRIFFAHRYVVDEAQLRVHGIGLLSRWLALERSVDLSTARIECRFNSGWLTVKPTEGSPVEISLDGIAHKHRFVGALFAGANMQTSGSIRQRMISD